MIDGNLVLLIWDYVSSIWIASNKSQSTEKPASIKEKYESNINTNVFGDESKNKFPKTKCPKRLPPSWGIFYGNKKKVMIMHFIFSIINTGIQNRIVKLINL